MRTTIDIPDELMHSAMEYFGFKSKRETVVQALQMVRRHRAADLLRQYAGKIKVDLNINESRRRPGSKKDPWKRSR